MLKGFTELLPFYCCSMLYKKFVSKSQKWDFPGNKSVMKSFINHSHLCRKPNILNKENMHWVGVTFLCSFKLSSLTVLTIFLLLYDTLIILFKRFELLFLMLGLETWMSTSLSASLYFSLCKHIPSFPAGSNTDGCLIATEAKMLH